MTSKWKKPNWYPDKDVKATKQGWVYTKNHNEVLEAISNLISKVNNSNTTTEYKFKQNSYFITSKNLNKQKLELLGDIKCDYEFYNKTAHSNLSIDNGVLKGDDASIITIVGYDPTDKRKNTAVIVVVCGVSLLYQGMPTFGNKINKNSSGMVNATYIMDGTQTSKDAMKQLHIYSTVDGSYDYDLNYIQDSGIMSYLNEVMLSVQTNPCKLESSDPSILSFIDSNGSFQTYDKSGTVTLTATSFDNKYKKTYTLVVEKDYFVESMESVISTVNGSNVESGLDTLKVGDVITINTIVTPSNFQVTDDKFDLSILEEYIDEDRPYHNYKLKQGESFKVTRSFYITTSYKDNSNLYFNKLINVS